MRRSLYLSVRNRFDAAIELLSLSIVLSTDAKIEDKNTNDRRRLKQVVAQLGLLACEGNTRSDFVEKVGKNCYASRPRAYIRTSIRVAILLSNIGINAIRAVS